MPKHAYEQSDVKRREDRFTWPWSAKGWYAEEVARNRDSELDALIQAEGRGKRNPFGYYQGRPALAASGASHNPYTAAVMALAFAGLGLFLLVKLWSIPLLALFLLVFFSGCGVAAAVINVARIPSWHRARRVAKAYLATHGGRMPFELRPWN